MDSVTIASDVKKPFSAGKVLVARVSADDQQQLHLPGQPTAIVKGPPPTESIISGPFQHEQGRLVGFLLRDLFSKFLFLRPIPVDERAPIRLPQDITVGTIPSDDGDRLFASLYNMRLESPECFEALLDKIRIVYPSFSKLDFPVAASGKISLYWYDKHNKEPLDQRELSDGTLRFLWLLTILHSPNKPPLVLIDEPEVSMHPQMLMVLADAMKEASAQTQLIVATHSDRLLRWMNPEDVCVMDVEDGQTKMTWLDPERLKSWLERYTLDELWHMGELGGRP
jgi:predicted ATPase